MSCILNPYTHAALKQGFDYSMNIQRGLYMYKRPIDIAKNSVLITFCIYSIIDNKCVNDIAFIINLKCPLGNIKGCFPQLLRFLCCRFENDGNITEVILKAIEC